MVTILVIALIAIVVIAVAGYALGLFKIEKVEIPDDDGDDVDFALPGEDDEDDEAAFDLDDGVSLKEKMELNGYFDGEKAAGEEPEAEDDNPKENEDDDRFVALDRLSEFKTGRGYLIDCQKLLTAAKASGEIYAAAYFDFDRFRFINSLKGMSIGDYVLTRLSQELDTVFPEGSLITRISADHFAAVCPLTGMDMFETFTERLRDICEKLRSDVAIKSGLRICMGVSLTEASGDYDISILLHKANIARHCIKVSRSETWKQYEDSMISTWLYGESALEDYSENQYDEEFVIYYTPQQEVSSHNTSGCEALVRWVCEDDASKVLPYTMNKSKIPTNSSKVLYQVCKAMSRWRKSGKSVPPTSVAVPVTQFYMEDLDGFLGRCLSEFQLEPSMLAVVVEASIIRLDWSTASRQISKLRDIGVRVGVDEIDIGYSGLEFLSGLKLDFVKLHRSFAADIHEDVEAQNRLRRMLSEAKGLGCRVILEGADHKEQLAVLHELGVEEIQGIYCGRPLFAEEFGTTLSDYVEKHYSKDTVILDDNALRSGDYKLF